MDDVKKGIRDQKTRNSYKEQIGKNSIEKVSRNMKIMEDAESINTDFNISLYPSVAQDKSTDFQQSEKPLSHDVSFAYNLKSTEKSPRTKEVTARDIVSEISEPSPYQIVRPDR